MKTVYFPASALQILKENPDNVKVGDSTLHFRNKDAISFGYYSYGKKILLGYNPKYISYTIDKIRKKWNGEIDTDFLIETLDRIGIDHTYIIPFNYLLSHPNISEKEFEKVYYRKYVRMQYSYAGRIWVDSKIISFWEYPPKDKINDVISDLLDQLKNIYNISLNINEIRIDMGSEDDYNTSKQTSGENYGSVPRKEAKLVSISEYSGDYQPSDEELNTQHSVSPMNKNMEDPKRKAYLQARNKSLGNKLGDMPLAKYNNLKNFSENTQIGFEKDGALGYAHIIDETTYPQIDSPYFYKTEGRFYKTTDEGKEKLKQITTAVSNKLKKYFPDANIIIDMGDYGDWHPDIDYAVALKSNYLNLTFTTSFRPLFNSKGEYIFNYLDNINIPENERGKGNAKKALDAFAELHNEGVIKYLNLKDWNNGFWNKILPKYPFIKDKYEHGFMTEKKNNVNESLGVNNEVVSVADEVVRQILNNPDLKKYDGIWRSAIMINDVGFIGKLWVDAILLKNVDDIEESYVEWVNPQLKNGKIYEKDEDNDEVWAWRGIHMRIESSENENDLKEVVTHEIKHIYDKYIELTNNLQKKPEQVSRNAYKHRDMQNPDVQKMSKILYLLTDGELSTYTHQSYREMGNGTPWNGTSLYNAYQYLIKKRKNIDKVKDWESIQYTIYNEALNGKTPSIEQVKKDVIKRLDKGIKDYGYNLGRIRAKMNENKEIVTEIIIIKSQNIKYKFIARVDGMDVKSFNRLQDCIDYLNNEFGGLGTVKVVTKYLNQEPIVKLYKPDTWKTEKQIKNDIYLEWDTVLNENKENITEGERADRTKYESCRWFFDDIIQGMDDDEQMKYMGIYKYRLYKSCKKFMKIFPQSMIDKYMRSDYDAPEALANYFVFGKVTDVFSTYALLKQNEYTETRVSDWKKKGYYLNERNLRTLSVWGYIDAHLNMGLDNISLKEGILDDRMKKHGGIHAVSHTPTTGDDRDILEKYGLSQLVIDNFKNNWTINLSLLASKEIGSGNGTRFLTDLCTYADKNDKAITVNPIPLEQSELDRNYEDKHNPVSFERLINYYKKFGFQENGTTSKGNVKMIRYPNGNINENIETKTNDLTNTPQFKEWFGSSKVVDGNGKPLMLYHGSQDENFNTFDKKKLGTNSKAKSAKKGFFFTDDESQAKQFVRSAGGGVYPVYLRIINPLIKDFGGKMVDTDKEIVKLINRANYEGNDGVIALNLKDGFEIGNQYVVFDPYQIKSINNNGNFDVNNSNIYENIELEVDANDVKLDSFKQQKELHPKLWPNGQLNSKVRLKLLQVVDEFIKELNIPWVEPEDIVLTGSLSNFNYSQYADLDVHLIYDFNKVDEKTNFVKDYFDTKKTLWNNSHENIKIYGFPVELYVEDIDQERASSGIYSLEKNEWIIKPEYDENKNIKLEKYIIKEKAARLMTKIDDLEEEYNRGLDYHQMDVLSQKVKRLWDYIKKSRREGIKTGGDMAISNVVFKVLRRLKYLGKLYDLKTKVFDKINSINK
jgi:translation initiation factor 1 (eIF-1/SUI1)